MRQIDFFEEMIIDNFAGGGGLKPCRNCMG